jgi:hypothetical protein
MSTVVKNSGIIANLRGAVSIMTDITAKKAKAGPVTSGAASSIA